MTNPLGLPLKHLDDANRLRGLLALADKPWWEDAPPEAAMRMVSRDGKELARIGYLLGAWATATAKAWESLEACEQLWPKLAGEAEKHKKGLVSELVAPRFSCSTVDGVVEKEVDYKLALQVIAAFRERTVEQGVEPPSDAREAYHLLCRYRDECAIFGESQESVRSLLSIRGAIAASVGNPKSPLSIYELEALLRKYRAANYLYGWIVHERPVPGGVDTTTFRDRYEPLFWFVGLRGDVFTTSPRLFEAGWVEDVRRLLPSAADSNARHILARLLEGLTQTDYEDLVTQILLDPGQEGYRSAIGNIFPVQVVPGEAKEPCEVLIAFAKGIKGPELGLRATLNKLHAALTTPKVADRVKVVILVTDCWCSDTVSAFFGPEGMPQVLLHIVQVGARYTVPSYLITITRVAPIPQDAIPRQE